MHLILIIQSNAFFYFFSTHRTIMTHYVLLNHFYRAHQ